MNILELNFEKGWRGGERQTLYNMQGFKNVGISPHLICRKGFPLEFQARKEGFTVYAFQSIFGVILFLITKGRKYNFLHAQTSQILTYCVFTKIFHKAKIIFTRRVNFIQKGFLTKLKYRFTDKIIAISNAIKSTLTQFSKRNDIDIISDIVIKKEANKAKAKEAIATINSNNRHIVSTTSALTSEKDPFTMVDAIKKLSSKRNDFIFLHFGDGNLKKAIINKIEEYNLQDTYFLMGFVPDMEDFFSIFEVFVMASKEEGLGSSVLDAFINKVPVVSTNAGGLKDLLQDERGIICEIGNSTSIAEGIDSLLKNSEKKYHYIINAFNYVCQYHSMEYITDKYITLMKKLYTAK